MFLISAYSTIPSNNCIFGCPPDFSQNTVSVFCKKSRDIQKDLSETWLSRKAWPCTNKASIWIFKYEKHIVSSIFSFFSLTGQGYGSSRLFHSFQAMAIKHLGEQTGADTWSSTSRGFLYMHGASITQTYSWGPRRTVWNCFKKALLTLLYASLEKGM